MNIIYERTGIRYHEVHIYRLLHKWKFSPKVPRKRFVNTASKEEKKQFNVKTDTDQNQYCQTAGGTSPIRGSCTAASTDTVTQSGGILKEKK